MSFALGNIVSLETSTGEVVKSAQVFGHDEQHSILILKEVRAGALLGCLLTQMDSPEQPDNGQ